jgi:hypothetical protein
LLESINNGTGDWSGFVNNSQQGLQLDFDNDKLDKLETNGKTILLVLDLKGR